MALTSSMEDYLEAVFMLQKQKGYVRCVDVAEHLSVTKPSVSRAVKELTKMKYLVKKADGTLSLTEQGQNIAEQVYEKPIDSLKWVFLQILQHRTPAGWNTLSVRKAS